MKFTRLAAAFALTLTAVACGGEEDSLDHDHSEDSELFAAAYEETAQAKGDDTGCSGVRVPDQSGFNKRVILTFDDGPNPATTPKVIETLRRHNAPATFFTNGNRYNTTTARQLARAIANDPLFILANHSQRHANLGRAAADVVQADFKGTDDLIRAAGETPKYFRFPYGAANCSGAQVIRDNGNIITGWHIDSADWCYAATNGARCRPETFKHVPDLYRNDMKAFIMSQIRARNGGILLMHDVHASTANALDAILVTLKAEGYTIARLDDKTVLPKLNGQATTAQKFIGDACTTDADCAFTSGTQRGRCDAAGFCTIACGGGCPDAPGKATTFCIANRGADQGMCVSKVSALNNNCRALPKTEARVEERYLGSSSLAPSTATVCAPKN